MRIVKKYSNRRLYDTVASRYMTLEDLTAKIRDGQDVQVVDARTRERLGDHARAPAQVELIAGAAVDEDALQRTKGLEFLRHEAHRVGLKPVRPLRSIKATRLSLNRESDAFEPGGAPAVSR